MSDEFQHQLAELIEIGGVWRVLFPVSGMCAEQRGSSTIEPIDIVKAIFVVDLERVSMYWDNWQDFEKFVLDVPLADGRKQDYINRFLYLMSWHLAHRDNAGQLMFFPPPSSLVQGIVLAAQELASARSQDLPPSSRDFLLCACRQDQGLSEALQKSGLQLERLACDLEQN